MGLADLGHPHRQARMLPDDRAGGARVVEMDVREEQMAQVGQLEAVRSESGAEGVEGRRRPAVEQRQAVLGVHEVHADRVLEPAEMQVDHPQLTHNAIFSIALLPFRSMRWLVVVIAALFLAPAASAQYAPAQPSANTEAEVIHYVAHDGVRRSALLLLPITESHRPIPLIISPHGRGVGAAQNALFWGDLPGEGDFAVVNPAGEGRRLHWFSWGARGQIADLARMPAIARGYGVRVDPRRIYAFGGSMGGQE